MKKNEQFNLEEIKTKTLEQFFSGKSLYGKRRLLSHQC